MDSAAVWNGVLGLVFHWGLVGLVVVAVVAVVRRR